MLFLLWRGGRQVTCECYFLWTGFFLTSSVVPRVFFFFIILSKQKWGLLNCTKVSKSLHLLLEAWYHTGVFSLKIPYSFFSSIFRILMTNLCLYSSNALYGQKNINNVLMSFSHIQVVLWKAPMGNLNSLYVLGY